MARHSLDHANLQWVHLLEHMNGKIEITHPSVPISVLILLGDRSLGHATSHRRSTATSIVREYLIDGVFLILEHLAVIVENAWGSMTGRPYDFILVMMRHHTHRRVRIAARHAESHLSGTRSTMHYSGILSRGAHRCPRPDRRAASAITRSFARAGVGPTSIPRTTPTPHDRTALALGPARSMR